MLILDNSSVLAKSPYALFTEAFKESLEEVTIHIPDNICFATEDDDLIKNIEVLFNYTPVDDDKVMIRHTLAYDFEQDYALDIERLRLDRIMLTTSKYMYIPGAVIVDYTTLFKSANRAEIIIHAICSRKNTKMVCNVMINNDILFFARG